MIFSESRYTLFRIMPWRDTLRYPHQSDRTAPGFPRIPPP